MTDLRHRRLVAPVTQNTVVREAKGADVATLVSPRTANERRYGREASRND